MDLMPKSYLILEHPTLWNSQNTLLSKMWSHWGQPHQQMLMAPNYQWCIGHFEWSEITSQLHCHGQPLSSCYTRMWFPLQVWHDSRLWEWHIPMQPPQCQAREIWITKRSLNMLVLDDDIPQVVLCSVKDNQEMELDMPQKSTRLWNQYRMIM